MATAVLPCARHHESFQFSLKRKAILGQCAIGSGGEPKANHRQQLNVTFSTIIPGSV